ncbi:hypothetical protein [Lactiplantibacillus xiangfangensis]|uniref:Uncharacterized protein n=1 Tax=Lactiplantibacillus xiangfangensis TaxID=942150 RepID=A0A0R2MBZ7_9LACO|nr:hypothetical protein [Lactiplantibacillus xiangfangensis]KRO11256.1 hypothetical protein IV64_GL002428 [Lactiplantibacillus xiangfangensis]
MFEKGSNKLVTGFMLGAALMGTGLTTGLVYGNASRPVMAQAKTKTKKVTLKNIYYKDGKKKSLSFSVPYGTTISIPKPKFKGYVAVWDGGGEYAVDKNGNGDLVHWSSLIYMKKLTTAQQKKNAKSKKAITAKGIVPVSNITPAPYFTARGLKGTLVTIAAPKVAGYTALTPKLKVGIEGKKFAIVSTTPRYAKNSSFGYKATKVKATKSTKSGKLKVKGTFAIKNKKSAKKHAATHAVITDYKGNTHVKLNSKKAFNKSIKKRAAAKKVTVMAAYRTKKHNSKSYTYHMLSVPKKVTVKATK